MSQKSEDLIYIAINAWYAWYDAHEYRGFTRTIEIHGQAIYFFLIWCEMPAYCNKVILLMYS